MPLLRPYRPKQSTPKNRVSEDEPEIFPRNFIGNFENCEIAQYIIKTQGNSDLVHKFKKVPTELAIHAKDCSKCLNLSETKTSETSSPNQSETFELDIATVDKLQTWAKRHSQESQTVTQLLQILLDFSEIWEKDAQKLYAEIQDLKNKLKEKILFNEPPVIKMYKHQAKVLNEKITFQDNVINVQTAIIESLRKELRENVNQSRDYDNNTDI